MSAVALVTGAARGIGRAIASRLLREEHRVVLLDVDDAVSETATALGAEAVVADISDPDAVHRALTTIESRWGAPALVANNAGIGGPFGRVDELSDADWNAVLQTNLTGTFFVCRRVLPAMRAAGFGRIVNIASIQGMVGAPLSGAYVASKHGVIGLTRVIAAEHGHRGITCNAICPGYIETDMAVHEDAIPEHEARITARTPSGRLGTPDEIASLAAYLCRKESGYMNGSIITADGGITADLGLYRAGD